MSGLILLMKREKRGKKLLRSDNDESEEERERKEGDCDDDGRRVDDELPLVHFSFTPFRRQLTADQAADGVEDHHVTRSSILLPVVRFSFRSHRLTDATVPEEDAVFCITRYKR